jgi:hypothetical protein
MLEFADHMYSKEEFNNAQKEALSPEDQKRLETYRKACFELDKEIWGRDIKIRTIDTSLLSLIDLFRSVFVPGGSIHYQISGRKEHEKLEDESAQTKKGQIDLAHEEANFFNEAFQARAQRLENAIKFGNGDLKEYNDALTDFHQLIKDLNEGNLGKYSYDIADRKNNPNGSKYLWKPVDMRPNAEEKKLTPSDLKRINKWKNP